MKQSKQAKVKQKKSENRDYSNVTGRLGLGPRN